MEKRWTVCCAVNEDRVPSRWIMGPNSNRGHWRIGPIGAASNWTSFDRGNPSKMPLLNHLTDGCGMSVCLNVHQFASLAEAQAIIEAWRVDYNTRRPHSSLDTCPQVSLSHNVRANRSSKKSSTLVKNRLRMGPTSKCQKFLRLTVSIYGKLTLARVYRAPDSFSVGGSI